MTGRKVTSYLFTDHADNIVESEDWGPYCKRGKKLLYLFQLIISL